ncbi:hypothetical protein [Bacterioplanoides pacificum]|uniref:Uncharacterized protein n=1 Tax=Bacterioplanoides pacificum TaxID=1171596 RepID=A0ABV7VSZ0_9GAMM
MDKEAYLAEVERRLRTLFRASKEGMAVADVERHRTEGFMQGAVFMGFVTPREMDQLMEQVHLAVFGKKISERRRQRATGWNSCAVDYSQYDRPTFRR